MSILNPESLSVSPPSNHVRGAVTLVKRAIKDTISHSAKPSFGEEKLMSALTVVQEKFTPIQVRKIKI